MSEHSYYRAFPEVCGLYHRLRRDRPFHMLYAYLTLRGPGPFFLSYLEPSDVSGTLDWLADHETSFGSRAEADRLLNELRGEIERTTVCHPGIEHRATYLEQVQEEMEGVLAGLFRRQGHPSAEMLAEALLLGREPLAPGLFDDGELQVYLVSGTTVREGAAALQQVMPGILEEASAACALRVDDCEEWCDFYQEAARRGDAVAILTA